MKRSPVQQRFVDNEIAQVLIRAGLNYDNPIRQVLDSEAEIVGPPGKGYLRVRDARGELVSPEERVKQLRADPSCRECFPDPPKVARNDDEQIRENFERIARGEVEVVK